MQIENIGESTTTNPSLRPPYSHYIASFSITHNLAATSAVQADQFLLCEQVYCIFL
uniref:Uncharacterized protein n=1 Tax=Utricularia reniformis TaxID=192314 RepID=A0A1Y0B009_9LAMI|nr:hypothetical protein AEK19_MT0509 [Utricularia reniformis]ART30765.1 hypothetical protein AEK19_MT0509 [Utricularia reniformis]